MFCRELFGKKPQKLEFGLQPHKIPDCDVVRTRLLCNFSIGSSCIDDISPVFLIVFRKIDAFSTFCPTPEA